MTVIHPLKEVRVFRRDFNTHYGLTVREDRLQDFYQFLLRDRSCAFKAAAAWGGPEAVSGGAVVALSALFVLIPNRFPVMDLLLFLRDYQKEALGEFPNPTINVEEIEIGLERWANTVSQLRMDGSDVNEPEVNPFASNS